jgi:ABC-type branched-subunit amino acid transport system substrate-binding protein
MIAEAILRSILAIVFYDTANAGRFTRYPKYGIDLLRNVSNPDEQYVIGMATSASMAYTDEYFYFGRETTSGFDLFTNWVNLDRGGINLWGRNYSLAVDYVEDYSNQSDVSKVYSSMVSKYDIFHSPCTSGLSRPAVDVTDPAGKLIISAASTTSIFANRTAAFPVAPSNNGYLDSSMGAFSANGAKSVAVLKDSDYGGCGDTPEDSAIIANKYNLTLHRFYLLDSSSSNYSGVVREIALDLMAHNVETVVGCSYSKLCYAVSPFS